MGYVAGHLLHDISKICPRIFEFLWEKCKLPEKFRPSCFHRKWKKISKNDRILTADLKILYDALTGTPSVDRPLCSWDQKLSFDISLEACTHECKKILHCTNSGRLLKGSYGSNPQPKDCWATPRRNWRKLWQTLIKFHIVHKLP